MYEENHNPDNKNEQFLSTAPTQAPEPQQPAETTVQLIQPGQPDTTERYQSVNSMYSRGGYSNTYPNDFEPLRRKEKPAMEEKKKRGWFVRALSFAGLGIVFGLFAGVTFYAVSAINHYFGVTTADEPPAIETTAQVEVKTMENMQEAVQTDEQEDTQAVQIVATTTDVTGVVEKVMPSVVLVNSTFAMKSTYFGQESSNGGGSGIIVGENDKELLVVTNYHVVSDISYSATVEKITVVFVDGEEVEAQVKGSNADMDLAILAVPLSEISSDTRGQITIAELGDSDALKVGEPAIAIGNSLGYGQSVTTGVISALNREIEIDGSKSSVLIQTDAAINPGNSGGALLNISGQVVGINSNKIGGTIVEGMGYAIPISAAKPIIEELMLQETRVKATEPGFLGVSGIEVTDEVAELYGLPKGLYLTQVYENTAAEEAGLVRGDIITQVDDWTIRSFDDLKRALEYYSAGDEIEITISQGSPDGFKEKTITVTLGKKS